MADQRSSPIDIENPEARAATEEGTSPQTSIFGSLIDNAMKGAQAATNYLLSFVSPPEQQPQPALISPIDKSTPSPTSRGSRKLGAEHESQVLAGWCKSSAITGSPPYSFPTQIILSEYKKSVKLERDVPEHPILSLDALSTVFKITFILDPFGNSRTIPSL